MTHEQSLMPEVKINILRAEYPDAVVITIEVMGDDADARVLSAKAILMAVDYALGERNSEAA